MRPFLPGLTFFALAACGGGTLVPPSAFLSGGVDTTGNGLPPADGTQVLADLEGTTATVRLARFVTSYATGETILLISDEEVIAGAGYGLVHDSSFTVTVDGMPVVLTDGSGTALNGQDVATYLNSAGSQSGTISVYTYSYGDRPEFDGDFDMEAYHAFGFETAPVSIAARTDLAHYAGTYFGFGQILDSGGSVAEAEVENNGNIALTADFAKGTIGGAMAGTIEGSDPRDYTAQVSMTSLVGNGFGSTITLDCPPGASCASASLIGGAFYGAGAEEISGVMGFDETLDGQRYVGAAGFTAVR